MINICQENVKYECNELEFNDNDNENDIKYINKELYKLNNDIYKREIDNIRDKKKIKELHNKLMNLCEHEWIVDNTIRIDKVYICKICNINTL
jgi:hypothetical protein